MQLPILSGIYTDATADFRTSYPVNLVPVPKSTGISEGYLKTAEGIGQFNSTALTGLDRGGINWRGICYRVIGSQLMRVNADGSCVAIGEVGFENIRCTFDYSFDNLAISSGRKFYLFDGAALKQVTDSDLGEVLDHVWIDGYHATTDGTSIVVTELNDPASVNPLKYGSSEVDPDEVMGLLKVGGELIALNRYTIEIFSNVGGEFFPFQRVDGAMISKGIVGTHAKCLYAQSFAFVGSGRNEPCSVYLGGSGQSSKIATREVELIIAKYDEAQLSRTIIEAREYGAHQHLYIHLPNETLVYDIAASATMQTPVWFVLSSAENGISEYRAYNFVFCYNKWICGDKFEPKIGYMITDSSAQYGKVVGWQFDTSLIYNGSKAAQVHSVELIANTGRAELSQSSEVFLSYTRDGMVWSQERPRNQGRRGDFPHRITWFRGIGMFRQYLNLRIRGAGKAVIAMPRLEVELEPLNV